MPDQTGIPTAIGDVRGIAEGHGPRHVDPLLDPIPNATSATRGLMSAAQAAAVEAFSGGGLIFKGSIHVAADFPTLAAVQTGWEYGISSAVTDNDPTKTNTGQSFVEGELIVWTGTDWFSSTTAKMDKIAGTDGHFASVAGTGGAQGVEDSGVGPSDFATAAQGSLADSAVQPGDAAHNGFSDVNTGDLLHLTATEYAALSELAAATPKIKFSAAGGLLVKLTNKTGAPTVMGAIVEPHATVDSAFQLTTPGDNNPIGVIHDAGVADGADAYLCLSGLCEVLMVDGTVVNRGDVLVVGSVAGRATAISAATIPLADHWREIGHALSASAGGVDQKVKAFLHFN